MKKHVKRVLTLMLIFAMLLSGVPVSYASGESAGSAGTGEVLFENNFDGE